LDKQQEERSGSTPSTANHSAHQLLAAHVGTPPSYRQQSPGHPELGPGVYVVIMEGTALTSESVPSQETTLREIEVGTRVVIDEVVQLYDIKRVRGRAINPEGCEGWISLLDTETGYRWAEQQDMSPGTYVVIAEGTTVTTNKFPSKDTIVQQIVSGSTVEILEVAHIDQIKRVRGRIQDPPGWISLLDTEYGFCWAEKQDECIEFMDADGDHNLFRINEHGQLEYYSNTQLVLQAVTRLVPEGLTLNFEGVPSNTLAFQGVLSCDVPDGREEIVTHVMALFQKQTGATPLVD